MIKEALVGLLLFGSVAQACEVTLTSDFVTRQSDYHGHVVAIDAPEFLDEIQVTFLYSAWYLQLVGVFQDTNCSLGDPVKREGYLYEVTVSCKNMHRHKDFGSSLFTRHLFELRFHALRFGTSYVTPKMLRGNIKGCVASSAKVVVN